MINNQNEWQTVRFGGFDMSCSGCEIIATYNALVALGEDLDYKDMANLIFTFECDGAMLQGGWGVAPSAIDDYLSDYYRKDDDVRVKTYVAPKKGYTDKGLDHIGKNNDVFVVTAYNNKEKVTDQIHTVCIAKQKDGSYSIYNANKKNDDGQYIAKKGYTSLSDAIKNITNTDPQLICLVAIDDKNL